MLRSSEPLVFLMAKQDIQTILPLTHSIEHLLEGAQDTAMNKQDTHFLFACFPSSYSESSRGTDRNRLNTVCASRGGHKIVRQYLGRHLTQPGHGSERLPERGHLSYVMKQLSADLLSEGVVYIK